MDKKVQKRMLCMATFTRFDVQLSISLCSLIAGRAILIILRLAEAPSSIK